MARNNSMIENYELVKELAFVFNNIEPKIVGRIYNVIMGPGAEYTWEINYYCRLEDEIDAYVPGAPFGCDLQEAERKLLHYVQRFESAADWRLNEYF